MKTIEITMTDGEKIVAEQVKEIDKFGLTLMVMRDDQGEFIVNMNHVKLIREAE